MMAITTKMTKMKMKTIAGILFSLVHAKSIWQKEVLSFKQITPLLFFPQQKFRLIRKELDYNNARSFCSFDPYSDQTITGV